MWMSRMLPPDRLGLSGPEGFGVSGGGTQEAAVQTAWPGAESRSKLRSMKLMALGVEGPRMAIRRDSHPLIVKGHREDILGPSVSSEVWRGLASGSPGKCKGGRRIAEGQ